STGHRYGGETSGKAGIPIVAEVTAKGSYDHTRATSTAMTETRTSDGIGKTAKEIANSSFIVFLDDFHYIPKNAQAEVARQIKTAAERGIRISIATVPHRADD